MSTEQIQQAIREQKELIRQSHDMIRQSNLRFMAVHSFLQESFSISSDYSNALSSFFKDIKIIIEDLDSLIMNLGSDDDEDFIDVRDRIVAEIAELCERWGDICRKQEENGRRYREKLEAAARGEEDVSRGVSP